jgi:hypothetical protein
MEGEGKGKSLQGEAKERWKGGGKEGGKKRRRESSHFHKSPTMGANAAAARACARHGVYPARRASLLV